MKTYDALKLAQTTQIACQEVALDHLPEGFCIRENVGLITTASLGGKVVYRSDSSVFEVRGTVTPKGDYLVLFPEGHHYGGSKGKSNTMLACRSKDKGLTWSDAEVALRIDYNQHGFIPLIPRESNRIYCFGTQPVWEKYSTENGQQENAPIGYFYSDDDGYTWVGPHLIAPENDPEYRGMSVMRMCETDQGTWLLGSHVAHWQYHPLTTFLYILRSDDQGKTWTLLPGKRETGWNLPGFDRMDEGRVISLGGQKAMMMIRTPAGHIWATWSDDDGQSWCDPQPTTLIHPDAPPMVYQLSDKKTMACFHHNRHHDLAYNGLSGSKTDIMKDRSELWISFSRDDGHTWSEPRFLLANAAEPDLSSAFRNHQCSYIDVFIDKAVVNILIPHRWQEILHLTIHESELEKLPTQSEVQTRLQGYTLP